MQEWTIAKPTKRHIKASWENSSTPRVPELPCTKIDRALNHRHIIEDGTDLKDSFISRIQDLKHFFRHQLWSFMSFFSVEKHGRNSNNCKSRRGINRFLLSYSCCYLCKDFHNIIVTLVEKGWYGNEKCKIWQEDIN